jgi:hypothetical protein
VFCQGWRWAGDGSAQVRRLPLRCRNGRTGEFALRGSGKGDGSPTSSATAEDRAVRQASGLQLPVHRSSPPEMAGSPACPGLPRGRPAEVARISEVFGQSRWRAGRGGWVRRGSWRIKGGWACRGGRACQVADATRRSASRGGGACRSPGPLRWGRDRVVRGCAA